MRTCGLLVCKHLLGLGRWVLWRDTWLWVWAALSEESMFGTSALIFFLKTFGMWNLPCDPSPNFLSFLIDFWKCLTIPNPICTCKIAALCTQNKNSMTSWQCQQRDYLPCIIHSVTLCICGDKMSWGEWRIPMDDAWARALVSLSSVFASP